MDKKVYEKAEFLMRIGPLLLNINDMAHHVDASHGLAKISCAERDFFRDLGSNIKAVENISHCLHIQFLLLMHSGLKMKK